MHPLSGEWLARPTRAGLTKSRAWLFGSCLESWNHPCACHGKNSQCRATWEEVSKSSSKEKNWEGCLPTLRTQTWHSPPEIPQVPKPEPPIRRTVQDTPRHCGCASRAADRYCLEVRQRCRHTNISEYPRYHLKGTAPWRAQKPHPCPDCWQISPTMSGLMSTPTGLQMRGWKMAAAESTSNTLMMTPLPSWFPVAFSAPTIKLRYWLFVQLQSTC